MSHGTVISFCDRTGAMVLPWLEAGYDAVTVDLKEQENPHPRRRHIICDVRKFSHLYFYGRVAAAFAFPPCTHFAVSGARWFKGKGLDALQDALSIFNACRRHCESYQAPWMIENQVGTICTITEMYWRGPDYRFDPCDYGDPYTKQTCIWAGGGFRMPPIVMPGDMFSEPTWVEPTMGSMIHKMPPSADRGDKRSITPGGFARAVFEANHKPALVPA